MSLTKDQLTSAQAYDLSEARTGNDGKTANDGKTGTSTAPATPPADRTR